MDENRPAKISLVLGLACLATPLVIWASWAFIPPPSFIYSIGHTFGALLVVAAQLVAGLALSIAAFRYGRIGLRRSILTRAGRGAARMGIFCAVTYWLLIVVLVVLSVP